MSVKQRRRQANYLKVNGSFQLLGAGFSDLNESPSAKTTSKKYITDKAETKTIVAYDWSSDYSLDQIRSDDAIDYICNIGEMQLVGSDAETQYVIVDLDSEGSTTGQYKARLFNVAVEVKDFKEKDGEMQGAGSFLGKGDPIVGTFDVTARTFTAGWTIPALGALTVTSVAGTNSGYTKITVTPAMLTVNSYVYTTAATVTMPSYQDDCSSYANWDGISDILATTGNKILIVEVNGSKQAMKAGQITVTSKV